MEFPVMSFKDYNSSFINSKKKVIDNFELSPSDIPKNIQLFIDKKEVVFNYYINESDSKFSKLEGENHYIIYSNETGRIYKIQIENTLDNTKNIKNSLRNLQKSANKNERLSLNFKLGLRVIEFISKNLNSYISIDTLSK